MVFYVFSLSAYTVSLIRLNLIFSACYEHLKYLINKNIQRRAALMFKPNLTYAEFYAVQTLCSVTTVTEFAQNHPPSKSHKSQSAFKV